MKLMINSSSFNSQHTNALVSVACNQNDAIYNSFQTQQDTRSSFQWNSSQEKLNANISNEVRSPYTPNTLMHQLSPCRETMVFLYFPNSCVADSNPTTHSTCSDYQHSLAFVDEATRLGWVTIPMDYASFGNYPMPHCCRLPTLMSNKIYNVLQLHFMHFLQYFVSQWSRGILLIGISKSGIFVTTAFSVSRQSIISAFNFWKLKIFGCSKSKWSCFISAVMCENNP